jgi:hypothetical protein
VWLDEDYACVYKLFDLRPSGALGKKIVLEADEDGRYDIYDRDAVFFETIEKIALLHEAGAHPTEIVGVAESGDCFIVKQPLAFRMEDYEKDRSSSITAIKGIPLVGPFRKRTAVLWLREQAWLVGDLHERNIMRDSLGRPTIIDALIGTIIPAAVKSLRSLEEAIEDAHALALGVPPPKRRAFDDVDPSEL